MAYIQQNKGGIQLEIYIPPYINGNVGLNCTDIKFSGTYNGGLNLKFTLIDENLSRWDAFYKNVWYPRKLKELIYVHFKIRYTDGSYPETSTRLCQLALTKANIRSRGGFAGMLIDFEAISTADYQLSYATASGKAYKGRISQVIEQVIAEHSTVPCKVIPTLDSKENYWYMMRQRPPRFIRQLMEMGTMFTKSNTQMVYGVKEYAPSEKIEPLISICPQGERKPQPMGRYKNTTIFEFQSIGNEDFIALQNKISCSGISSTTGEYIDVKSDPKELYSIVKDSNTSAKITAGYPSPNGFIKQNEAIGFMKGTYALKTPPELYSDGCVGYMYRDYIRNRSVNQYMNSVYNLMHARFNVFGIGLMDNTIGLGTDTIYIDFDRADDKGIPTEDAALEEAEGPGQTHHWTGSWTLMGFEHTWNIDAKSWLTTVDISRFTTDAKATRFSEE